MHERVCAHIHQCAHFRELAISGREAKKNSVQKRNLTSATMQGIRFNFFVRHCLLSLLYFVVFVSLCDTFFLYGSANKWKEGKKIQVQNRRLCFVCTLYFFYSLLILRVSLGLVNRTTILCTHTHSMIVVYMCM